jgi:hypothetical protein
MVRIVGVAALRCCQMASALLLLLSSPAWAADSPPPPYYSLQVASTRGEAEALAIARGLGDLPDARVEARGDEYAVRFGAWASREDAERTLERYREQNPASGAFLLRITNATAWIQPDAGAPAAAPDARAAAAVVAGPVPAAPDAEMATPPVDAATPGPAAPPPKRSTAALRVPDPVLAGAGAAFERWWKAAEVRLEDLGWGDGFLLEGATGSRDLHLPVPLGIDARSANVALNVHFGDSLIGESTVMLSVNGTPRRTLRRADAGPAGLVQVQLPLTRRDLRNDFVHVRFDYTQLADRDVCFSEALAGAWTRIEPDSGLVLAAGELPPTTVQAAWALLPRDVVIAADLASLGADEFQALFRLASLLRAEGRDYRLLPVAAQTPLKNVPAHIVLSEPAAATPVAAAALPANRSLYVAQTGNTARLVLERGSPAAVNVLSRSWRGAAGVGVLEVASAAGRPAPKKVRNHLRLSDLGFSEGERRFRRTTRWDVPLPFGAMGQAMRPDWVQLQVYAPNASGSDKPTVLSAYYNDRLVYSGTLAGSNDVQAVEFALPRHLLRARNQLSLVAQRDPGPGQCATAAAGQAISIAPASRILLKPVTDLPETFADLVPYESSLKIYLPEAALAEAQHVIPFLVAAGAHFWPSAQPPAIEFYAPDQPFKPDGPFLVVGQPRWEHEAPVKVDQGPVRISTAAGGQEFAMLEMQPVAEWALLQMAQSAGHAGAWVMAPGGFAGLPSQRLLFEDEDVALLDRDGVQLALRVGPTRDYEVSYPENKSWFDAAGRARVLLFSAAWILIASVIVYLLRASRRHRGPPAP